MATAVAIDADQCDQCPHDAHVAAFVYAEFSTGTLALCGHHGTAGWDRLNRQAVRVIDFRHLIGGS